MLKVNSKFIYNFVDLGIFPATLVKLFCLPMTHSCILLMRMRNLHIRKANKVMAGVNEYMKSDQLLINVVIYVPR